MTQFHASIPLDSAVDDGTAFVEFAANSPRELGAKKMVQISWPTKQGIKVVNRVSYEDFKRMAAAISLILE